ncbi:MAG: flagellar hook-basal body protein [Butyrivibrio sp.]|nr:flagellar hook-basal body protein [Butyrivibrio sp.]
MVRSLWSGASGMNAQQTNVDTIANNLANVNSAGYKAQSARFKSLLYQEMKTKTIQTTGSPVNSDVGLGVRVSAINQHFSQGSLLSTDSPSAFAIEGDGFFAYSLREDQINQADNNITRYTRNGNFVWALRQNGNLELTTSEGYPVIGVNGQRIEVVQPANGAIKASDISIDADGNLFYIDPNAQAGQNQTVRFAQIATYQFRNAEGLERVGDTSWSVTAASGQPIAEFGPGGNVDRPQAQGINRSVIVQNYLEGSNVNIATEMVNLIVAQRAYEMNSTSITTTDEMMQTANQLKR